MKVLFIALTLTASTQVFALPGTSTHPIDNSKNCVSEASAYGLDRLEVAAVCTEFNGEAVTQPVAMNSGDQARLNYLNCLMMADLVNFNWFQKWLRCHPLKPR